MHISRILIIAPAWIGDTVIAHSLIKYIKQQQPASCIDALAPTWTAPLFSRMPEIHHVTDHTLVHGQLQGYARYRLAKQLRKYHYTQAIILPHSFKSALIPWLARIPQRTGCLGEYRYGLINDLRYIRHSTPLRLVDEFLQLGYPSSSTKNVFSNISPPLPTLQVFPHVATALAQKYCPTVNLKETPIIALCIGAAFGPAKRWPMTHFATIAAQQLKQGWTVWIFGSLADYPAAEAINQHCQHHCYNFAGSLHLTETIDLLSLVTGVITNDSGLMHVTAALRRPLIALYGPTSPHMTPPLSSNAIVLTQTLDCQPCFKRTCPERHHHCLQTLSPERVLSAIACWPVPSSPCTSF